MIKQLRCSGGIWININNKNIIMDPGPGSIVHCNKSRPKLDPETLDAIILSHKHLDHCSDINVMIEAMTSGGFKKKGTVFCTEDAITVDPVILKYAQDLPNEINILTENSAYEIGDFKFQTSMRHKHPSETYGIKFYSNGTSVSFLTDTKYFPELCNFYNTDIIIICVSLFEEKERVDHLCVNDVKNIIKTTKPKKAILTHFGRTMLENNPDLIAEKLSRELHTEVIAAWDGMKLEINS